ncbi:M15 family metallopeptidase [Amycolatopsis acidiphila]|uniref:D-alanyl-D-alanine dipeptidase n=1 Tax=Amycolatopsis acidiphila TaxID=715473 RepID=A0A558ALT3_9PSEU|nr:M15 family metallopeptidase [Amycolatopsis acidiphila]TVT25224.1 M15 family metallopeptidase [Amycolatopsis acidiphila]UIJ62340.1 M15 family metallopeptidase [Amycolatopsis acidiphila]GHG83141.1 D-alanyl-D-alanine dipeptidase [Amycolatopsis acidiphila]
MTVLLSDPLIAAISAGENGEPLVDLREVPGLRLGAHAADPLGAYALARSGVLDRLLAAQAALPDGVRLLVIECYRPPKLQQRYFAEYREELRAMYPKWTDERLHVEASKFVSPPEVAPHCTGGAVDLTLATGDGAALDLGTAVNANPEASAGACFTAATGIPAEARRNRDLLVAALTGAGLVNYPTEWWHWSYGERYWAHVTGTRETRYSAVTPPVA